MRYSMAAASLAHTYGNVATFVNTWLLELFPPNYFKTNYINSTIAYRDFATYNNNRKAFIKKQKPMLIMRPRIELDAFDELPINQTYFGRRMTDFNNNDIYEFITAMSNEGKSSSTIIRRVTTIRQFYKFLQKRGY